uniref:Uncharacterized protein n=1 Tax=Piliocolobus tephrosceles TaxID=591936 RepID=A0A8C9LRW0_9PRIM
MQSPPDWPPATDALRPSPFPHPALHALHGLAHELLFPAYWALDQLLGCCAPTASPISLGWLRRAAGGVVALLLLVVGLPLALTRLPLWLALQVWRRPFCYQPPPLCWAPAICACSWTGWRASATCRTASHGLRPLARRSIGLRTAASRGPGRRTGRWWPRCPWVWTLPAEGMRSARGSSLGESPDAQPGPGAIRREHTWPTDRGRTSSYWTAGCCWPGATRCCAPPSVASPTRVARTRWPPGDYCPHRYWPTPPRAQRGRGSAKAARETVAVRGVAGAAGQPGRAPHRGIPALHALASTGEPCGWVLRTGPASPWRLLIPTFACTPAPPPALCSLPQAWEFLRGARSGTGEPGADCPRCGSQSGAEPTPPSFPAQRTGPCAANS